MRVDNSPLSHRISSHRPLDAEYAFARVGRVLVLENGCHAPAGGSQIRDVCTAFADQRSDRGALDQETNLLLRGGRGGRDGGAIFVDALLLARVRLAVRIRCVARRVSCTRGERLDAVLAGARTLLLFLLLAPRRTAAGKRLAIALRHDAERRLRQYDRDGHHVQEQGQRASWPSRDQFWRGAPGTEALRQTTRATQARQVNRRNARTPRCCTPRVRPCPCRAACRPVCRVASSSLPVELVRSLPCRDGAT